MCGRQLDVIVTDHKIKLKMRKPSEAEDSGYAWDEQMFTSGNIHKEGFSNSIKPQILYGEEGEEVGWITNEKYKTYMENKLMRDIIEEGSDSGGLTLFHVLVILSTFQAVSLVAILWYVM